MKSIMNKKNYGLQLCLSIVLVCMGVSAVAREFILKNNSHYSIYVRNRSNEEAAQNLYVAGNNYTVSPGSSIVLDDKSNYSIKTAGDSLAAQFYNVPLKDLLQTSVKSNPSFHMDKLAHSLPVVVVSSGYTYGWYFTLDWQKK